MSQDILAMGGDSEANLYGQAEMMKSTRKKQGKYMEILPEVNRLIKRIEWVSLRNNIVIALVMSILISSFIYFKFLK